MNTKFNVGDKVYLEATVVGISIDRNGTTIKITYCDYMDHNCMEWVKEDQLNAEA